MGTIWMMRVLGRVAEEYGLVLQKCNTKADQLCAGTGVIFANHSQLDLDALGDFVGSHMIRDPRDVVVSGYFYHLWTNESWAHVPSSEYDGQSFQQYLNSVNQSDGILAEINRFANYVDDYGLRHWNYSDDRIIEIRYEDLIKDEESVFQQIFRHYGFHHQAVRQSVKLALEFSFSRVTRRSVGQADAKRDQHLRSGKPGQWQTVLSSTHRAAIKEKLGDVLVMTGYERDLNW